MKVNVDNFTRVETDRYFAYHMREAGGLGRFKHIRQPTQPEYQPVIRMNRDTLYSAVVFDLTEPATILLPDAGGRFMSMMVVNENHFVKRVAYDPGAYTLTAEEMGTRYAEAIFRTFMNSSDPEDVTVANALQDRIQATQKAPGVFEVPDWDQEALAACRAAILGLGPFAPDSTRTFGDIGQVDPVRHLIGTARTWGGNPEQDAIYVPIIPEQNDGHTAYMLHVKDVPVDAFWSITVYNGGGYLEQNDYGAYAVNNVTATPDPDGSITVHFGGDPRADNFLYIMPGWNYLVRLYRPQTAILNGSWQFPEPVPAV